MKILFSLLFLIISEFSLAQDIGEIVEAYNRSIGSKSKIDSVKFMTVHKRLSVVEGVKNPIQKSSVCYYTNVGFEDCIDSNGTGMQAGFAQFPLPVYVPLEKAIHYHLDIIFYDGREHFFSNLIANDSLISFDEYSENGIEIKQRIFNARTLTLLRVIDSKKQGDKEFIRTTFYDSYMQVDGIRMARFIRYEGIMGISATIENTQLSFEPFELPD